MASLVFAGSASAWTTVGGSSSHPFATTAGATGFKTAWIAQPRHSRGSLLEHGVTVCDGRVHGVTLWGTLFALNAATGRTIWKRDLPGGYATSPACLNGRLFVNNHGTGRRNSTYLRAFNARTGKRLWARHLWVEHSEGAPNVLRGHVYVAGTNRYRSWLPNSGKVMSFTVRGRRRWQRKTCGTWQSPVWTGRVLVAGSTCGRVTAFSRDGKVRWRSFIPAPVYAQLGYAAGRVIIPGRKGVVYALGHRRGRRIWARRVGWGIGYPDCAVTRWRVWCGNQNGTVAMLRARNGRPVWKRDLHGRLMGAVTLVRRTLWVAPHDPMSGRGVVLGLRPDNGRIRVRFRSGKYDPAAAAGRTTYLVHSRKVRALR